MTPVAMTRSHGSVPVQKKSKTLVPTSRRSPRRQPVEESKDEEANGSADLQPVGCLELTQIHICLHVGTNSAQAHRTPCKASNRGIPRVPYCRDMPTALLSVYDKAGIVEFAAGLHELGWRIVSSGGTAKAIAGAGVAGHRSRRADRRAGDPRSPRRHPAPEDPRWAAGRPDQARAPRRHGRVRHRADRPRGRATSTRSPASPSIELIDIGGPAMVRAAAKNHQFVGVVVDPADYARGARRAPRRRRDRRRRRGGGWRATRSPGSPRTTRRSPPGSTRRATAAARRRCTCRSTQGAAAALRREPAPGRRPLPRRGPAQLVGRRRATRRQGDELPQPVRHRGGVAARATLRRRRRA